MPPERLVVVRHARTWFNARRIVQGPALDPDLDRVGRAQARALGRRLAAEGLDAVWSSPLRRAVATGEPAARLVGCPLYEDERLREVDWGAWNGRPKDASLLRRIRALAATWAAGDVDARPPGGESAAEVARRAGEALRDALRAVSAGPLLVVGHGRVNKVLLSLLVHGDAVHQEAFPTSNVGVTVLHSDGPRWRASVVDDLAHVRARAARAAPVGAGSADA